ncbi:sulfite exporter TauE/SafE family protein [Alloscardovia criceti]|uniref:sulfite exporter TauE/SafE family protein n=1 Tax=Alloscardovia criceti TaxID=356828 RepID=UPI00039ECA4F|nr:sulfite exporter TauE/SafE family protein [Alloscardovia criceti]
MKRSLSLLPLIAIGVLVGIFSGLFGVGGGTIMVPALMFYGLSQREASATSLAAMPLASLGGVISYAVAGNVDWAMGALIIVGSITGAWVGARLLHVISEKALRWCFVAFLLVIIVQQFFQLPTRTSHVELTLLSGAGMILLGFVAGVLAALLGVGGGAILVPGMASFFGASDLVSRGTSLLAILPGAISGTISNVKARIVQLKTAAIIGIAALVVTPIGEIIAQWLTPQMNKWAFIIFLIFIIIRSIRAALRAQQK